MLPKILRHISAEFFPLEREGLDVIRLKKGLDKMRIIWYNGIIKEGSDQRGGTYNGVLF